MSAAERAAQPLVRLRGIDKSFPGVRALDGVDLTIMPGEVHALTGENGSGKSTLAKVLAGVVQPDAGTIEIDGERCTIASPAAALKRGIVLISQELTLAPTLSVAENVYLGRLRAPDWASSTGAPSTATRARCSTASTSTSTRAAPSAS